ncbi:MAG: DMT family transporter [Formivibrio sp.]|nr:DMT family transporter [Formivibrio sp.]
MPNSDTVSPAISSRQVMRGIAFYVVTLLLFAYVDTTTKYLANRYTVPLLIWVRYCIHLLFMTVLFVPRERGRILIAQQTWLVALRAFSLVLVSLLMGLALQRMPLAEVTAVQFIAPLLVTLLAGPLLKEKIGWVRGVCVVAGFCGVLLVVRPGSNLNGLGLLFVFLGALGNAFYQMISRLLGASERPLVMLYYLALIGFTCTSLALPWFWTGEQPTTFDFFLLISLGLVGVIGHLLFSYAYRDAPASTLAPITYLQLFWSGILGWLVFGHIPTGLTLLGMLIITVSGAVVAVYGHLKSNSR